MMKEVLVVRANCVLSARRLQDIRERILSQMKSGVILLPVELTALIVPEDIEIKVEDKNEHRI